LAAHAPALGSNAWTGPVLHNAFDFGTWGGLSSAQAAATNIRLSLGAETGNAGGVGGNDGLQNLLAGDFIRASAADGHHAGDGSQGVVLGSSGPRSFAPDRLRDRVIVDSGKDVAQQPLDADGDGGVMAQREADPLMAMQFGPVSGDAPEGTKVEAPAPGRKASPAALIAGIRSGDIAFDNLAIPPSGDIIGGVGGIVLKVSDARPGIDRDALIFDADTGAFLVQAAYQEDDIAFR
jgi:hypothetical protein